MQRTDAEALIRHFNLKPDAVIECQAKSCSNTTPIKEAFAIETIINGEPAMAFLCSDACFLNVIHPSMCWRA